jgi:hypothetical protein
MTRSADFMRRLARRSAASYHQPPARRRLTYRHARTGRHTRYHAICALQPLDIIYHYFRHYYQRVIEALLCFNMLIAAGMLGAHA